MHVHCFATLFFLAATAQALRFRNGIVPIINARDINPTASLGPARASVASVLRTAISPSDQSSLLVGPNPILAPGENPPAWYLDLPADAKSLLPVLYPVSEARDAGVITSVVSTAALSSTVCSTTTTTITLTRVPVAEETESSTTTLTTTSTTTLTKTLTRRPSATFSTPSESDGGEALESECSSTTTLTTTMTLTFTETSSSQATPLSSTDAPVLTRASVSLTVPSKEPATATTTGAVYSTPPFPFSNATASVPVNVTTAGVPSQTPGSAPEQFTNAAVAGVADVGVMTFIGMGVVCVWGLFS